MTRWGKEIQSGIYPELIAKGIIDKDQEPSIFGLEYYIDAFRELSTCRIQGGPIPFTAIVEYAKVYQVEELEDFIYLMRKMDNILLEAESKNTEDKSNGSKVSDKNHKSDSRHVRGARS